MLEQELVQKIQELARGTDEKPPISPKLLENEEFFLNDKNLIEILSAFKKSAFSKGKDWKWRQFVHMVLEPEGKREFMYQRTVLLLSDFGNRSDKYFELETESGLYHVPDELSKLNRLNILHSEFFNIYENILRRFHFDYPKEEFFGRIKGNVNWKKTIEHSREIFPLNFISNVPKKNFSTPENILLFLCLRWIYQESKRLLEIKFPEPLTESMIDTLNQIYIKTKDAIEKFPFLEIVNDSKEYWNASLDEPDFEIKFLEKETRQRLIESKIKNQNYFKLLHWIQMFRDLSIKNINNKSPTRHILSSLTNVDTMYEIWIFMELASFLRERGILVKLDLGKRPKIEFNHGDHLITIFYNKEFKPIDSNPLVWSKIHNPDYLAILDGNYVLGVFDAKNYDDETGLGETQDKILAYMNNFNTSLGALFYPNHPKLWDEVYIHVEKEKREELLAHIVETILPNANDDEKTQFKKELKNTQWDDLDDKIKQIVSSQEWDEFVAPKRESKFENFVTNVANLVFPHDSKKRKSFRRSIAGKKWIELDDELKKMIPHGIEEHMQNLNLENAFHKNQKVAYLRFPPENGSKSIELKNQSLNYLYDSLISAIPKTLAQNTLTT